MSKRYSDAEKQAAVQFVQKKKDEGMAIAQAIEEFNKSNKPRGKAPLIYQNYIRWVK